MRVCSASTRHLFSAVDDGSIWVWDLKHLEVERKLLGPISNKIWVRSLEVIQVTHQVCVCVCMCMCVCVCVCVVCVCVWKKKVSSLSSNHYVCRKTVAYVFSNHYVCVLQLLYMCRHTTICVSSYYYVCVIILLYMCPHTTIHASSY